MRRGALAAALLAGLAGCAVAVPVPIPVVVPARADLSLRPAPGGIEVAGSGGREIGFGRAQAGALAAIARIEGRAPRAVPCGAGREAYDTRDLCVVFEGGRFVGWEGATGSAGRTCEA